MDLGPKYPDEIKLVTFPFALDLAGATIASCVVTCTALSGGVDAAAAAMVLGPAIATGTNVTQRIQAGVGGVRYQLVAKVVDSVGNVHVIKCVMTVKD